MQLVIDNEIARYVRRAVQGFDVTDEAINLDLIRRVGIGGNYLTEMETAASFREFLNLSPFFTADPWAPTRAETPPKSGRGWRRTRCASC